MMHPEETTRYQRGIEFITMISLPYTKPNPKRTKMCAQAYKFLLDKDCAEDAIQKLVKELFLRKDLVPTHVFKCQEDIRELLELKQGKLIASHHERRKHQDARLLSIAYPHNEYGRGIALPFEQRAAAELCYLWGERPRPFKQLSSWYEDVTHALQSEQVTNTLYTHDAYMELISTLCDVPSRTWVADLSDTDDPLYETALHFVCTITPQTEDSTASLTATDTQPEPLHYDEPTVNQNREAFKRVIAEHETAKQQAETQRVTYRGWETKDGEIKTALRASKGGTIVSAVARTRCSACYKNGKPCRCYALTTGGLCKLHSTYRRACTYVIQTGKRRGEACGRSCVGDKCCVHENAVTPTATLSLTKIPCAYILKYGPCRGLTCGRESDRTYCTKHRYLTNRGAGLSMNTCPHVFKRGGKKGTTCGANCIGTYCTLHKQ